MQTAKRAFSRVGCGLLAGAGVIGAAMCALYPLSQPEVLSRLRETLGPSLLLLLLYVPNVLFLILFWLIVRTMPKSAWPAERMGIGALVRVFLMMYAVSILFNILGAAISAVSPAGGTQQLDDIHAIVSSGLLLGFLIPALFAPVLEELIFRKLMIDRLHAYGETNVILFSALTFGLFHGNLAQFLYAACVGVFFGYVYCRTRNVLVTIIMHMILNSFSSALILGVSMHDRADGTEDLLPYLVVSLSLIACIAMFIAGLVLFIRHLTRRPFRADDAAEPAIPKGEAFRTIYLNPGVALFVALSVIGIVLRLMDIELSLPFFGS